VRRDCIVFSYQADAPTVPEVVKYLQYFRDRIVILTRHDLISCIDPSELDEASRRSGPSYPRKLPISLRIVRPTRELDAQENELRDWVQSLLVGVRSRRGAVVVIIEPSSDDRRDGDLG
jgi:hypothetical protein